MINIEKSLGTTVACSCGHQHEITVRNIIYEEDALQQLGGVLAGFTEGREVVIIADKRTWDLAGRVVQSNLQAEGWRTHQVILPDTPQGGPICDDITFAWLKDQIKPADIAVAVGSGVVNDLTKWTSYANGIAYVVVATAASMNGYTAANVAPFIKGVKSLITARSPLAVLAVPSLICSAPYELTAAGLGDMTAKPISTTDWMMNHIFLGEYFCRACSEIINSLEKRYWSHPEQVKARQGEVMEAIFRALIHSGIVMTMIGTSAPASGGEHLLSHTLDMLSSIDHEPHDLHGRQVGLGVIFSAALYERILRLGAPSCQVMPADIDERYWQGASASIRREYRQKQKLLQSMAEKIREGALWQEFRRFAEQQFRPPGEIKNYLRRAGAAHTCGDIHCSRQRLRGAILHMHEIRHRPTVVDLAWMLGIMPGAADEIIDEWLM